MRFLAQAWPAITTIVAIVMGVTAYRKQMLEIQELKHKLKKLESEASERDRRVYEPTSEEIRIYSNEERMNKLRMDRIRLEIEEYETAERRRKLVPIAVGFVFILLFFGGLVSYQKSKFDLLRSELNAQRLKIEELSKAIEEAQKQK
jgi:hypothetical protein